MATSKKSKNKEKPASKIAKSISNAPSTANTRPLEQSIGRHIKTLRQRKSLTAKALAERIGISVALMSRVEHGTVSPSLHTLDLIAQGLGVPFTHLFMQVEEKPGASHIPAGKGLQVVRSGTNAGQIYQLLGIPIAAGVQVEPYLITADENAQCGASFQHDGIEFIHVLEGEMVYRHGERDYKLIVGDSLFFDARLLHGPVKFPQLPTKFLSVISYSINS